MKNLILALLLSIATLTSRSQSILPQKLNQDALQSSFQKNSIEPLNKAFETIHSMKINDHIKSYWLSENLLQKSLYYFSIKDSKSAESEIEKAMNMMNSLENKNCEDLILLAREQSFAMQFMNDITELMLAEEKFYKYISQAKKLNSNNPRIYYVAGIYDYYKPVEYGGRQLAKQYLEKAKELYRLEQLKPTWGLKHTQDLLEEFE